MEWIDSYLLRPPPPREKSWLSNFRSLSINEDEAIDAETPSLPKPQQQKLESFDEISFSSSLQRQFKENGFTLEESGE